MLIKTNKHSIFLLLCKVADYEISTFFKTRHFLIFCHFGSERIFYLRAGWLNSVAAEGDCKQPLRMIICKCTTQMMQKKINIASKKHRILVVPMLVKLGELSCRQYFVATGCRVAVWRVFSISHPGRDIGCIRFLLNFDVNASDILGAIVFKYFVATDSQNPSSGFVTTICTGDKL